VEGAPVIIGTAGHIDHGKSALVTALTGKAVDRLLEERRRGITIDLNFAPLDVPGGPPVGIVDVPGHEDFVRTMVAGASGVDLVLLVIDLGEGPRPQTDEHLAIVEQLRIPRGIPVFTKADLVDPEWAELVVADFLPRLERSRVAWGPPAVVSAVTGQGIDTLRARLHAEATAGRRKAAADVFRMPVDRVFSAAGVGTVVTGTTWTGTVAVGDQVRVLPGDRTARIRSIESYGRPGPRADPGVRTALGMVGLDRDEIRRGDVVVTGSWRATTIIDGQVELLPGASHPLGRRTRVRLHLGTAEVLARCQPTAPIEPGGAGPVRFVLEAPLVARGGDRFVLRSYSPVHTIGGGEILDPDPPRRAAWSAGLASPKLAERIRSLAARRDFGLAATELFQLVGPGGDQAAADSGLRLVAGRFVPPEVVEAVGQRLREAAKGYHQSEPGEPGISLETVRQLLAAPEGMVEHLVEEMARRGVLRVRDGRIALSGFVPTLVGGETGVARLVELLVKAGLEIRTGAELAADLGVASAAPLLRIAIDQGDAQAVGREHYASTKALDHFREVLVTIGGTGEITPGAVRDQLGLSRKYLIPLLEWADRHGVTRRVGDARVLVKNGR
jgi:selenocysteine-specific elongation factor